MSITYERKIQVIPPKINIHTAKKQEVMLPHTAESVPHKKTRKPAMKHKWHTLPS